ncbi:MAG: NAD(P)-dependent oxidoreductase, partial [Fibrobacterota bacterium]
MNILLTGATGGLGRNTAFHLREHGHQVRCVGRDPAALAQLAHDGFDVVSADLSGANLEPLMTGIGIVVHAAARSSVWGHLANFERDNVWATKRLVEASIAGGVRRFVHVSTPSLLYRPRDQFGLRETDPLPPPANHYARTKALAESVLREAASRIEVVGIRPRGLYGPWDTALFPRLARANSQRGIPLVRGGRFKVDLTGMPNAVEALGACLTSPASSLGTFHHVSDGTPIEFRGAVEGVFGSLGIPVRWRPMPAFLLALVARVSEFVARVSGEAEPVLTRYSAGVLSYAQTLDLASAKQH